MLNTVLMFPGQASQYVGMGKKWYDKYESVRKKFELASDILNQDMVKLCFEGPTAQLIKTENTQVALVTMSTAVFDVAVNEFGIVPSYLAGHSIGEISALTAAGVFRFEDAVKLAKIRGQAMAECNADGKAGMSAVTRIDAEELMNILKGIDYQKYSVDVANFNAPLQTILSGDNDGMKEIAAVLEAYNAKIVPLSVAGPFHSRFMAPAKEKLRKALEEITLGDMKIPVVCGHEGRLYQPGDSIKDLLIEQLVSPIRWTEVVGVLEKAGVERWIEVGPNEVLAKLVKQNVPDAFAYSLDPKKKAEEEQNEQVLNPVGLCMGAAVSTRNQNWDDAEYKKGVIEPYKEMEALYKKLETENRMPTEEELKFSIDKLKTIFVTKGVSLKEQAIKYQRILKDVEPAELYIKYIEDRIG